MITFTTVLLIFLFCEPMHTALHTNKICLFLSDISLKDEEAIVQSKQTTSSCYPPANRNISLRIMAGHKK
jgi:hypothetical protein